MDSTKTQSEPRNHIIQRADLKQIESWCGEYYYEDLIL